MIAESKQFSHLVSGGLRRPIDKVEPTPFWRDLLAVKREPLARTGGAAE
jgi:hypothetical protein